MKICKTINNIKVFAKQRNYTVRYKTVEVVPNFNGYTNILTQDMINKENVKYVLKYDFDLEDATITVPLNCCLEFDGGSIKHGTIIGQDTFVNNVGGVDTIFRAGITQEGTWRYSSSSSDPKEGISRETADELYQPKGSYQPAGDYPTTTEVEQMISDIPKDVDDHLDATSVNPVQNKVVKAAIDNCVTEKKVKDIVKDVDNLDNYYTKDEVYTKTKINNALGINAGTEALHKISRTGNYNDLNNTPVADVRPVENSNNLVKSGGVYSSIKNVSDNARLIEERIIAEREARETEDALLRNELNSKQIEIGAVQTDSEPILESPNMLPSGAVASNIGYYDRDSEWLRVLTDAAKKVLVGIKKDGSVEWYKGIPKPIKDILDKIFTFLDGFAGYDNLDSYLKDIYGYTEINREYLYVLIDKNERLVAGVKKDSTVVLGELDIEEWYKNTECFAYTKNAEMVDVELDKNNRILSYRKRNGIKVEPVGIESPTIESLKNDIDKAKRDIHDNLITSDYIAKYNCKPYERINAVENIIVFGNSKTYFKNNSTIAANGDSDKIKFCLFTDLHVNANDNQKYHWWNEDDMAFDHTKLEEAFAFIDAKGCDFMLSLGDNINDGYKSSEFRVPELTLWDSIVGNNIKNTMLFTLCGNHDTNANVSRFCGKGIFSIKGVNFISIEASYVGISPSGVTPIVAGGAVSMDMLGWLDEVLTKHTGELNIVMCHYPLGSSNWSILNDYIDNQGRSGNGHKNDLIDILKRHNVKLYLSGHSHNPTWPIYDIGTNLIEINCGSVVSNNNNYLGDGAFALCEIDIKDHVLNANVYGLDTLAIRTNGKWGANRDSYNVTNLHNISV